MSLSASPELEAAFLLHSRPYRETSRLLDVLSQNHGRLGLVARGAQRPKSRWRAVLQPFAPLHISWTGRGSLQTLTEAEPASLPHALSQLPLMGGYYLNELMMTLLHRGDPHPDLFAHYAAALSELSGTAGIECVLRRFELALLAEIGYGLVTDHDVTDGSPVQADLTYQYIANRGPARVNEDSAGELILTGADLMAIGQGKLDTPVRLISAKRVLRAKLNWCLDGRSLKTRRVLAAMQV